MKKVKLIVIFAFSIGCLVAIAQAVNEINASFENGVAMEHNLNEPNATSPATNNIQSYEKDGVVLDKNNHPETNLSNSYNRSSYEEKK